MFFINDNDTDTAKNSFYYVSTFVVRVFVLKQKFCNVLFVLKQYFFHKQQELIFYLGFKN